MILYLSVWVPFPDSQFWFRPEWINTEFKLLLYFYSSNKKFTFKTRSLGKKRTNPELWATSYSARIHNLINSLCILEIIHNKDRICNTEMFQVEYILPIAFAVPHFWLLNVWGQSKQSSAHWTNKLLTTVITQPVKLPLVTLSLGYSKKRGLLSWLNWQASKAVCFSNLFSACMPICKSPFYSLELRKLNYIFKLSNFSFQILQYRCLLTQ